MPITREKKKEMLEKLSDIIKQAKSLAFVSFRGLTVANVMELRRAFRKETTGYIVAKKTLIKKALSEAGFTGELPDMPGETALAWSDDVLSPIRLTAEWSKKLDGRVKLVGGVFEGAFKDQAGAMVLAMISPMPILRGQFVNIINSPIQRFVIALSEISKKQA